MKQQFPIIKIGSIAKKVYSIDLSGGGAEPANLKISFLADNTNYIPNSNTEYTVEIGSYYKFKGYIVSSSIRESVSSGKTKELTLVDTSIILDKTLVGLKGKDGPPQAPLLSINLFGKSQSSTIDFGKLNPISSTSISQRSTNPITIFETKGNFPDRLILVGDAIDPCKDFESDTPTDKCDPCSESPTSKLDCINLRSTDILDVDYTFNQLISAASKKGIVFDSTFPSNVNYRAQYKGTLREVLNNWCQDYGYSFYWDYDRIKFINLSNGIQIRDEAINSENCKIEDFSETKSIEGNSRSLNIAYFGKAGEIKTYDCAQSNSNSSDQAGQSDISISPLSLEQLISGNAPLRKKYKNDSILKIMVTAAYYSKELRDLICYSKLLGFNSPSDVKIGIQSLMGWNIKAVCHENSSESDVSRDYSYSNVKLLYNSLLGSKNGKSAIFSPEKIEQMKKNGAYFLIVENIGTKAYEFEQNLAENFCGRYWTKATNRIKDVSFSSPDGSAKAYPNLGSDNKFILPNIDISHPLIKQSNIDIIKRASSTPEQDYIVLDRPTIWHPSNSSESIENFLNEVLKVKFENITSEVGVFKLKKDHQVYLVYSFGELGITLDTPLNSGAHSIDRVPRKSSFDQGATSGIKTNICNKIEFEIKIQQVTGRSVSKKILIDMPVMDGSYLLKRTRSYSSVQSSSLKTIIPKLEIIVTDYRFSNDDDCVSYNLNSQNITDNNLSRLERSSFNCYIDKSKIYTYADSILSDLNQNDPKIKITKNYTILGLPNTKFTPNDGLTSFSVRLDQSGTRTSLSFSNMFPVGESPNFKEQKLRNLLKDQSSKSYTNNSFK